MAIADRVQDYMMRRGVQYEVLTHPRSRNSMESAALAQVSGERLAKSVVLEDEDGFVMAVLSSTRHVRLRRLNHALNRKLHLATEADLPNLFTDCELGAIPPLGLAYGMETVVDDSLAEQPEIYFEAGDHVKLIRMKGEEFMALMGNPGHARFGYH